MRWASGGEQQACFTLNFMSTVRILVIDDEEKLRRLLARTLSLEGYQVLSAATVKSALAVLEEGAVQVVVSDVKLPDGNGVALTQTIKERYPATEVVVLTAYGTIADGVQAIRNGAFGYLVKGDDHDKIIPMVSQAADKAKLQFKVLELEEKIAQKHSFDRVIGSSPAIRRALTLARKVATTDTSVLLTGETGTGKEVFAQAIHYAGPRKHRRFVAVNCSAFGHELLESEMFGHKAGSFTGAVKDKRGLLEEADEGTIFLDEVGEMNLDLQAKLLRVLEEGTFIKVGETQETRVNVRVIAATNRNLEQASEAGAFRLDLFYRLAVFQVKLPSLNERLEDIPALASYFVDTLSVRVGKKVRSMHPAFSKALQQHLWKGNIRELRNVIERCIILTDTEQLTPDLLPPDFEQAPLSAQPPLPHSLDLSHVERNHIRRVLEHTEGNKTKTAELLGIGLTTLYRKIQEYGLQ